MELLVTDNLNLRRRQHFYAGLVTMLVASVFFWLFFFEAGGVVLPIETPVSAEMIAEYQEWVPELPVRLLIPSIGVDAAVQYVGLAAAGTGEMDIPTNFTDVGWYKEGVRPGMRGSAVMAGHYNGRGVPEAVFFDLNNLTIGDEVVIMSAERIEDIFVVVRVESYDFDASTDEVFLSNDGKARLNLITCGGDWLPMERLFSKRTVVFTEQLTDVE